MNTGGQTQAIRILMLITTAKLAEKASGMFDAGAVPMHYKLNGMGTASSEMMDILGLGSSERSVLLTMMPKSLADEMLKKIRRELRIGTVNSGIAFTMPLSGASNLILRMLKESGANTAVPEERKDEHSVIDTKYAMVAAIVDQGYSEAVMNAARSAGAAGGTVLHSRRIADEQAMSFWGFSVQEEKEIVVIVTGSENKLKIMQEIGKACGVHSEAKGMVISLPIDTVIGIEDK